MLPPGFELRAKQKNVSDFCRKIAPLYDMRCEPAKESDIIITNHPSGSIIPADIIKSMAPISETVENKQFLVKIPEKNISAYSNSDKMPKVFWVFVWIEWRDIEDRDIYTPFFSTFVASVAKILALCKKSNNILDVRDINQIRFVKEWKNGTEN